MLARHMTAANRRLVEIGTIFQRPLHLTFAMQDIQHCLNRRISELALQMLLHGLHIRGPRIPQNVHNLQFQRCQPFGLPSRHRVVLLKL